MKIVGISQNLSYCSWWRIEQPFKFLYDAGHTVKLCWLDENDLPTEDITNAVVVLQRIMKPGDVEEWIRRIKKLGPKKIIYELDDDVVSPAFVEHMKKCGRASITSLSKLEFERKQQLALINACDAITVSTQHLADVVRENISRKIPIYVLPNSLDIEWYKKRVVEGKHRRQNFNNDPLKHIYIGWAGGLRPEEDFQDLAEAWQYINKKYPQVKFVVGGYQTDRLYQYVEYEDIIRVPWAELNEWPATMQVDIGCMPLAPTKFNRSKSPIKAIEYVMSGAMPIGSTVAYDLPQLNYMPVVTSVHGWKYFLEYFVNNWLDRQLHVKRIQDQVMEHFNLSKNYKLWEKVYEA